MMKRLGSASSTGFYPATRDTAVIVMKSTELKPIKAADTMAKFLVEWIDPIWYLSQAQAYGVYFPDDTSRSEIVDHYLTNGRDRGFSPHPMFSADYYRGLVTLDAGVDPFEHFIRQGRFDGIPSHPLIKKGAKFSGPELPRILTPFASRLFDQSHYGTNGETDPLDDYLRHGRFEKSPHYLFDRDFYLARLGEDVPDPFLHYITVGWKQGHAPHPRFDGQWYLNYHGDVKSENLNPLFHYVVHGADEGRKPDRQFDPAFYAREYPDVLAAGVDPYIHYVRWGEEQGRRPNATSKPFADLLAERISGRAKITELFNAEDYLALSPDLAEQGADPYEHFGRFGQAEGRHPLRAHGTSRIFNKLAVRYDTEASLFIRRYEAAQRSVKAAAFAKEVEVTFIHHSQANYYMRPLAEALQHAVVAAGGRCRITTELDESVSNAVCPVIMAPHEFFNQELPDALRKDRFLSNCILYNTEQLPSKYFRIALSYMYRCKAAIDVNFQTTLALGQGFPAEYVLPPFDKMQFDNAIASTNAKHPLFRSLEPEMFDARPLAPIKDRPIDLFFAGFKTQSRNSFFIRSAKYLSDKECFLAYASLPLRPIPHDDDSASIFPNNIAVSANSKITLALHRYPVGFFEWERIVAQGFGSGSCIIGSPGLPSPFFKEGTHYFEAITRNIDKIVRWILDTDEGMNAAQKAADAAKSVLDTQLTAARVGHHLLHFLATVQSEV